MHNLVASESLKLSYTERTFPLYNTRLHHPRQGSAKIGVDILGKGF